jgi:hypothetical protein
VSAAVAPISSSDPSLKKAAAARAKPSNGSAIVPGNINLNNRPIVKNRDGTYSTVRSISIGVEGRSVLIPTVSDDGRVMSNPEAVRQYQATGRHLGIFRNEVDATAYAQQLHQDQASKYRAPSSARGPKNLWDLVADPATGAAPPKSSLVPKAAAFLDQPIPAGADEKWLNDARGALKKWIPTATVEAVAASRTRKAAREFRGKSDLERFGRQALSAALQTERGMGMKVPTAPPPEGFVEQAGELTGSIGGFVAHVAPLAALASTGIGALGAGPLLAGVVGEGLAAGGVAAAGRGGTPKQRLVSGVATGLTAGASFGGMKVLQGAIMRGSAATIERGAASAAPKVEELAQRAGAAAERRATEAGLGTGEAADIGIRAAQEARKTLGVAARSPAIAKELPRASAKLAAASAIAPAVAWGGVAPYLEYALSEVAGEKVEPPKLRDVARNIAMFGALNVVQGGMGRRGARGVNIDEPGLGTAGRAERGMLAGSQEIPTAPAPAEPVRPLKLDRYSLGTARKIINGNRPPDININPYDGGRTREAAGLERVARELAGIENPTHEQVVEAAKKARAIGNGMEYLRSTMIDPPSTPAEMAAATPQVRQFSQQTSRDLTGTLAGKDLDLNVGLPDPLHAKVMQVAFFPWSPQQVRVLVSDVDGTVAAFRFASLEDFRSKMSVSAPPAQKPAGEAVAQPPKALPGITDQGRGERPAPPVATHPGETNPEVVALRTRTKTGAMRLTDPGIAEAIFAYHTKGTPLSGALEETYQRSLADLSGILTRKDVSRIARNPETQTVERFARALRNKVAARVKGPLKELGRGPVAVPPASTGGPPKAEELPATPPVSKRVEGAVSREEKAPKAVVAAPAPPVSPAAPTVKLRGPANPTASRAPSPGGGLTSAGGGRTPPEVAPEGGSRPPTPKPPAVSTPTRGRTLYPGQVFSREADAQGFADRLNFRNPEREAKVLRIKEGFAVELVPIPGKPLPAEVVPDEVLKKAAAEKRAAKGLPPLEAKPDITKPGWMKEVLRQEQAKPGAGRELTPPKKPESAMSDAPPPPAPPKEAPAPAAAAPETPAKRAAAPAAGTKDPGGIGKEGIEHPDHVDAAIGHIIHDTGISRRLAEMQKTGATDAEIEDALAEGFGQGGGDSGSRAEYGVGGRYEGPWVSMPNLPGIIGPEFLHGQKLAARVREALGIPSKREALEAAGQLSMFGAEEEKKMLGPPGKVGDGATREDMARQEGGAALPEAKVAEGRISDATINTGDLWTNPRFQKRKTGTPEGAQSKPRREQPQVRETNVQALLRREGGFSMDKLRASPPVIWYDTEGTIGPKMTPYILGGHHRSDLADYPWGEEGLVFKRGEARGRDIPVKVYRGSVEEATKYASTINQETLPNTDTELATIAYEAQQGGADFQKIADDLGLKNAAAAENLIDFFHVDPAIRDQYGPDGNEAGPFGSRGYLDTLGSYVRRWPEVFTRTAQRDRLQTALSRAMSQSEFRQHVVDFRDKVKKIDPEKLKGIPEADLSAKLTRLMEPIDRVSRQVRQASALVTKLKGQLEGVLKVKKPVPGLLKSAQAQLKVVQKEYDELSALLEYVQTQGQKLAKAWVEDGKDMAPGLRALEEKVRSVLGEENPSDYGANTVSAFGVGPVAQVLSRALWRGKMRAQQAWARRTGKAADLDLIDPATGRKVSSLSGREEADPAEVMLGYRLGAWMKAGGNITLTRRAYRAQRLQRSDEHRWEKTADEMLMQDVWREDVLRWLEKPHSSHDRLAYDAIEGRASVPKFVDEALVRRQRFMQTILEECQKIAVAHGVQPPREILGVPGGRGYVSHIQGAYDVDDLDRLFIEFHPQLAGDQKRLDDARNNFFMHRESEDTGRKSVLLADAAYIRAVARWRTLLPLIKVMRSEIMRVSQKPKGAWRAETMRAFFQAHYFTRKGDLERMLDEGLRNAYYAAHTGQIRLLPSREVAEEWLGLDAGALENASITTTRGEEHKLARFYAAVHGVDPRFSSKDAAKLLGTTDAGMDVWGVYQGRPRRGPVKRKFAARWENGVARIRARLGAHGVAARYDENYLRIQLENHDKALAFHKNPTKIFTGRFLHRAIRSVQAYNLTAFVRNLLGGEIAIFTEYGPRHFLAGHGMYAGVKGYQALRSGLHAYLRMAEKLHLLTPAQRVEYDQLMPLLAYEMMGPALAAQPGEIVSMRESMERLEKGWSETDDRVAKLLGPMGHFTIAESLLRGVDAMAAVSVARSQGLRPRHAKRIYDFSENGRREAWKDLVEDVGTPGTVMDFVSERQGLTQYYYDPLGRPAVMSHFMGKLLMALQTYKFNYLFHQDMRPVEGFIRWLTGVGKKVFTGSTGRGPSTDAYIRHAAAVFLWQATLYGGLIAASDATGYNFLAASVPLWVGLLLLLDKVFRPGNEPSQRRWRNAQWGIVNPWAPMFGDMMTLYGFALGGRQGVLDLARMQLPTPLVLAKRLVEENPEVFDRPGVDRVYKLLGQKTALYGMSGAAKVKHHSGLMPPEEREQYRHKIGWRVKDSSASPNPFAPSTGGASPFAPIGLGGSL